MARALAPTVEQHEALAGLVRDGTLTGDQAETVRRALFAPLATRAAANPVSTLIEIVGYVGGGLILGGAVLLVELNLERLGHDNAGRLLTGYAVLLVLAGLLIGGGPSRTIALRDNRQPVRRRLAGVLMAIGAVPAAMAAALFWPDTPNTVLYSGIVGLAVAVAGYALLPTVPGMLSLAAMSIVTTTGAVTRAELAGRPTAFAFVGLGLLFSIAAAVRLLPPRHIGLAVGAAIAIVGAHLSTWLGDTRAWTYGLTFLIGLICFAGYWFERATVLLVFGVIATTIAIPEAVTDWTHDALSGPAILLISGAVLVGVSGLGLWLRRVRRPAWAQPSP